MVNNKIADKSILTDIFRMINFYLLKYLTCEIADTPETAEKI